jgi:anti-anti-sigma factor
MSTDPVIAIKPHEQVVWAVIQCEELNEDTTARMQDELFAAADREPRHPVVLDLSNVSFIPSLGLGGLLNLVQYLAHEGHRFLLIGLKPQIRTTLAVTKLDQLFEICYDMEAAENHLREATGA